MMNLMIRNRTSPKIQKLVNNGLSLNIILEKIRKSRNGAPVDSK